MLAEQRRPEADRRLGLLLAAVAGAVNAGGFLAVGVYTSHMTGLVSSMADAVVTGELAVAVTALAALLAFLAGAISTALLVNLARLDPARNHSPYRDPLLLQATLMLAFGLLGGNLHRIHPLSVPLTVLLLAFIMGLQNALVTKVSQAQVRTTHLTGILTDLGIELGRLLVWHRRGTPEHAKVRANRQRLGLFTGLVGSFFGGGVLGAWGFARFGFSAVLPLALTVGAVALLSGRAGPAADDEA